MVSLPVQTCHPGPRCDRVADVRRRDNPLHTPTFTPASCMVDPGQLEALLLVAAISGYFC